ncbi:50S ribosomal protein L24 [Candidatus Parcubacteria bacterium]|nr:50S ribosomal protein L24 [Candidatus Parcubacteria bacterium]
MKIHKNDIVLIISGKDKGKKDKILRVFPKQRKVLIEGVNIRKKHTRPKKQGEKGQIVEAPAPISVSNIKLICPKCGKAVRVGYIIEAKKKYRICKKCKAKI